jgi:hypothetical protein
MSAFNKWVLYKHIHPFADLTIFKSCWKAAVKAEREACAKICESKYEELVARDSFAASTCRGWITRCAEAIRNQQDTSEGEKG